MLTTHLLHSTKALENYAIRATNGNTGDVKSVITKQSMFLFVLLDPNWLAQDPWSNHENVTEGLSASAKYLRFFSAIKQLSPSMLHQFTHPEFPDSYAVIATVLERGRERQIGVARFASTENQGVAEFAVVVTDDWQGHGIATRFPNSSPPMPLTPNLWPSCTLKSHSSR